MKKHINQAIRKEWNRRLKEECAGKSSLRWLHLPPYEQLHVICRDMNCQSHTRKATIKAMMTTECYVMLNGSTKTKSTPHVSSAISVNPRTSTPSCAGVPTRRLRTPLERFLPRLIRLLHTALGFERLDEHSEYNEIVQLALDCTAYDPDESRAHTHDTAWLALESHCIHTLLLSRHDFSCKHS